MMEEIKPKKERKFLKAMREVALTLVRDLLLNVGKKVINKVGNKRQGLVVTLVILASTFAIAQYPTTNNKQRLGFQTTGDGLVFRGRASDTTALKPSTVNNAYHLFDTLNNVIFSYIKTKGGWKFNNSDTVIIQGVTMPFDSITFNTAKDGTVGVGEVEYNDTQGSLIQGLKGGNVTNVIGQQLHQRVNNRTGATLNKGDVVYLAGSQGNRITVAKAIATSDPTSANTFGIVAESIADNQSGYIITEGLITGLNTLSLTQDSAVYLSGTTAGALTSTKPQAPIHGVYIGVCVKTNAGSGEVFVKIRNGSELDELHDVQISSPLNNASLYFKSNEGLWRDTTAALLVSDTASMLTNYLRTGVAANSYLPLTGGTLSGNLNLSSGILNTWTSAYNSAPKNDGSISRGYFFNLRNSSGNFGNVARVIHNYMFSEDENSAAPQTFYYGRLNGFYAQNYNAESASIIYDASIYYHNNNQFYYRAFSEPENKVTFSIKPSTTVNSISGTKADLYLSGDAQIDRSLNIGTTLGVTGATTLSNLSGTGSRMVVASSAGLLSTQAIPTGTVTSVGGTGSVNGITLSGTVTSSGNLTLGGTLSGVSLSSQVTGTLPIGNGGTGATTAATARTNLGATVRGANTFLLTDIGAISFLRYNADNTVSQRAADGMRSDLGGTTIGQSMFTLTNPSAIRFPQFNTDNTVSALDAASFRTAIGAGTGNGNGTVTNVTGTLPISVATGTTTPSITIANASTTASGVVTTGTQSMAGNKTFTGDLATSGAFSATGFSTLTGGASIGTMATTSTLTNILGVNSSNAIGEISLGSGLSFSSGTLSVTGTGTFTTTNSNYTVTSSDTYIAFNNNFSNITVTLPSASGNTGRQLYFRNVAAGSIISASNNIINNTVTTGTPDNSILGAGNTNYKWCTLVSDGTYWIKMQAN